VTLEPLPPDLRDQYLDYLGVDRRHRTSQPAPDLLAELHRAQLARVPYENLEIQLGRATTIDPYESAKRILTGRGGYCFHLNGAFAALLASLGYDVVLTRGAVPSAGEDGRWWGNHMVLIVRFGADQWLADVGLGDGILDPLPLVDAVVEQPPFRYRLEHVNGSRWRFHHDEHASIAGFDLDVTPVDLDAYGAMHAYLSADPQSSFVQKLVVQRRLADHALTLRGCVLTRVDALGKHQRDVLKEDEWLALFDTAFGLRLDDVDAEAMRALWQRVRASHEAWERVGRP
jgi:arylamine N-acetyltransferase